MLSLLTSLVCAIAPTPTSTRSRADQVAELSNTDQHKAASLLAEQALVAGELDLAFVRAHLFAERYAHAHRAAAVILRSGTPEQVEARALLDEAARHLVSVEVELEAGTWADGGTLEIQLDDTLPPQAWMQRVDEVRSESPDGRLRLPLSAGTWSITLTTRGGSAGRLRLEVVEGERPRLRFASPQEPQGSLRIRVEDRCRARATTLRIFDQGRHLAAEGLYTAFPQVKLAAGSYSLSLRIDAEDVEQTLELGAGDDAEVTFTCPGADERRSPRRPLWISLGAGAGVGALGALFGGVGLVVANNAAAHNTGVLAAHGLSGGFNYAQCRSGTWMADSDCARADAVEAAYPSSEYHTAVSRGLQLRGLGLGFGSAALGAALGGLPALARSTRQRKGWLVADAALGALAASGGVVLLGIFHPKVESALDGYDREAATGTWRVDRDDLRSLAVPWLASSALIGFGGALLIDTIILASTVQRGPARALRATGSGLELRF